MSQPTAVFMRFTAPDPQALERGIAETRIRLATAVRAGTEIEIIDAAADLGSMLTTARKELEAKQLLEEHRNLAETLGPAEPIGWFWNAYATALQYCGERGRADEFFHRAVELAEVYGWRSFQAFALHHWGRSLAEQRLFAEAESRISEALSIRIGLNESRQESSRRALTELHALQRGLGSEHAPSDA